jgi:hypothetical protein
VAGLVSFGGDGLRTSFARSAAASNFSSSSFNIETERDSGWIF